MTDAQLAFPSCRRVLTTGLSLHVSEDHLPSFLSEVQLPFIKDSLNGAQMPTSSLSLNSHCLSSCAPENFFLTHAQPPSHSPYYRTPSNPILNPCVLFLQEPNNTLLSPASFTPKVDLPSTLSSTQQRRVIFLMNLPLYSSYVVSSFANHMLLPAPFM